MNEKTMERKAMQAAMRELRKEQQELKKADAAAEKERKRLIRAGVEQKKKLDRMQAAAIRENKRREKAKEKGDKWEKTRSKIYVADFETTTLANYEDEGRVRVFMWGLMKIDGTGYETGHNIESFIESITRKKGATIIFHNLAFDGVFVEDHLLNRGYQFFGHEMKKELRRAVDDTRITINELSDEMIDDPTTVGVNTQLIEEHEGRIKGLMFRLLFNDPYTFSTIRDKMNNVFALSVRFSNGNTVKFIDSLKWFPGTTVAKLGEMVGVPKLTGDFDYKAYRTFDYNPTPSEHQYLRHDVEILQKAVDEHLNNERKVRLTRTSYAFNHMLATFNVGKGEGEKFKDVFPPTDVETWKMLKPAYNGGLTLVMPGSDNRIIEANGFTLDFNSLYPFIMMTHMLPFGEGVAFDGSYKDAPIDHDKRPLYVVEIRAKFKLKPGMVPSLAKSYTFASKSVFSNEDIATDTMMLTNLDVQHFFMNYDVTEYEEIKGMAWQAIEAPFAEYIKQEMKKKVDAEERGDKLGRYFAKLNMNGCYGYFGKSIFNFSKDTAIDKNGVVSYVSHAEEVEPQQYLPAALFITAGARHELLNAAYVIINTPGLELHYMDTDSLHFTGDHIPAALNVDKTRAGALSIDAQWWRAKFMRAKLYAENLTDADFNPLFEYKKDKNGDDVPVIVNGKHKHVIDVKGAGLTDDAKSSIHTLEDLDYNKEYPGGKMKKTVKGGILIVDVTKTLYDHRKMMPQLSDTYDSMKAERERLFGK